MLARVVECKCKCKLRMWSGASGLACLRYASHYDGCDTETASTSPRLLRRPLRRPRLRHCYLLRLRHPRLRHRRRRLRLRQRLARLCVLVVGSGDSVWTMVHVYSTERTRTELCSHLYRMFVSDVPVW